MQRQDTPLIRPIAPLRTESPPRLSLASPVRWCLLIVLAVVALAACGGGESSEETSGAAAEVAASTVVAASDSEAEDPAEEAAEPEPTEEAAEPEPAEEEETAEPEPADEPIDESALPLAAETIDWTDCGQRLQCGTVTVPIDYADPSGGTLDVALSVHRATSIDDRIGYLLMNPGGPGESGAELIQAASLVFTDDILEHFDIVGFDPRGVGATGPDIACGSDEELRALLQQIDELPDTPEEVDIGNQAAQLCVESMGPLATQLGTGAVVQDMDQIRIALGAEQISYIGFSYGSTLGGWYATVFPDRVRAMVVDGAANPVIEPPDNLEEVIKNFDLEVQPIHDVLERALNSCADETCPIWNDGDPTGYWLQAVDKLDLIVEETDNASFVSLGIIGHLYSEADWKLLHVSLQRLWEDDDTSGFIRAAEQAGDTTGAVSTVEYINCLDNWALFPELTLENSVAEGLQWEEPLQAHTEENYPLLAAIDVEAGASVCLFLQSLNPPVLDGELDGGGVPILVIGNESDPVTPYVQSEQYANDVLSDGRLVRVEAPQHVVYPSNPCVNDLVHAALIDLDYPDEEVICDAAEVEVAGLAQVTLAPVELPDGAESVVPDGWAEVAPGVFARGSSPQDAALLVFEEWGDLSAAMASIEDVVSDPTTESLGEFELNGQIWDIFVATDPDEQIGLAFAVSAEGTLVVGQASLEEIEDMMVSVLRPAVESYRPAGG